MADADMKGPGGAHTLSEATSKELLAEFGVPFAAERVVLSPAEAAEAAGLIGFPVALKLNGDNIAHKTERGLVRLNLCSPDDVIVAANDLLAKVGPDDGEVSLLVAEMVSGSRELICGLVDDEVFGKVVMLGVGGILAEAIADVVFRLVPLTARDAGEMIEDLASQRLFGPFRGEPAVDRDQLAAVLLALSAVAQQRADVRSVDLNPVIVAGARPVAVDALVELVR
jgi:acetyl-CoA synthetase (ADP-forming)